MTPDHAHDALCGLCGDYTPTSTALHVTPPSAPHDEPPVPLCVPCVEAVVRARSADSA